jgi:hypothetical protein
LFREEAEPHLEYVLQTLPQEESACLQALLGDQAADPAAQEALARKGYLAATGTGGFEPFSEEFRRAAERFYARRSR